MYIQLNKYPSLYYLRLKKKKIKFNYNKLIYGSYGLRAREAGYVTLNQIESARKVLTYAMGRKGRYWVRISTYIPKTSKGIGSRMGKGKGSLSVWVGFITSGQIFLEVEGPNKAKILAGLRIAQSKFAVQSYPVSYYLLRGL